LWVEVRLLVHLLQELEDNGIKAELLEATLAGLCERCADGEGNDNIVGVLLGAVYSRLVSDSALAL
jgi:hypothetical protein